MGFFDPITDPLFGTEGKTKASRVASFQQPYLEDLYGRALYTSRRPEFTALQQEGQGLQLGAARGLQPFISGAQRAGSFLTDPGILSPESNPYLAQTAEAATRPVLQSLMESILPAIRGEAGATGNVGSSRQGIAEGIAGRGAIQSISDMMAQIFSGAYGQGLGAMGQGLSLAPQTAGLGFLPGQAISSIGEERQQAPIRQLQELKDIIGPPTVLGQGGTTGREGILSINLGGTMPGGG